MEILSVRTTLHCCVYGESRPVRAIVHWDGRPGGCVRIRRAVAAMKLRTMYSEMPYGSALTEENLNIRCSTCFADGANIPCGGKCGVVIYCGEKCKSMDEKIHQPECEALQKRRHIDPFTRMLGRIMTRQMIDGGVTQLTDNFPSNIPDRSLSHLMSHQREIATNEHRGANMKRKWKEFSEVFAGTKVMCEWEKFGHLYCVMMINCFSVSGKVHIKNGHDSWLGLAFYLNTSRFNHGCRPDLYVDFNGALLVMKYASLATTDAEAMEERLKLTKSADHFNRLTISYGFSHAANGDSFFPLRRQRMESLEYGYYFQCQCVLCGSEKDAVLEEHAAALECNQCGQPCVWKRSVRSTLKCCASPSPSKVVCEKTCRCSWTKTDADDAKMYARSLQPDRELLALEESWSMSMTPAMKTLTAKEIMDLCEPVLMKARYFWHRWANLKMAHLNERLFIGYATAAAESKKEEEPMDPYMVKMALETGQAVLEYASNHPPNATYYTIMAAYAYRVGQLYELSASINPHSLSSDLKCAADCYQYALKIWETLGEEASEIIDHLNKTQMNALNRAMAGGA